MQVQAAHWQVTWSVREALGIELSARQQNVEVDVIGSVSVVADGVLCDKGEYTLICYNGREIIVATETLTML